LAIAFWSLLGSVLFTIVSLVLPPGTGWRQILWGAVLVFAGSTGSQLLPEWKKLKWLRWVKALCIGIVITVGALITTHGWNVRDNYLRNRALLVAVATEWLRNDELIREILLLRDIYDNDTSGHTLLTPEFLLPTAQESRDALIHSSSIHQDVILVRWLKNYYRVTDQFALALQDIRRLCSQPSATTEMKKLAMEQVFENSLIFEYFRQGHRHLGEFLDANYNWAVREAKARMDMIQ
jgi:hypothetical protein